MIDMVKRVTVDLTDDPRAALEIARYHTWRCIRRQSVGEHSAQIARIMLTVWPRCPRRLLIHAIGHDMDEMVGDIPYPFKKNFPELASGMKKASFEIRRRQRETCGIPPDVVLSAHEQRFFKLCEYIEMWEFGISEQQMGNEYAKLVTERMMAEIRRQMPFEEMPDHPGVPLAITKYIQARLEMEMIP